MSLARTDDSVHRERAAKASERLLASLRRHHGEGKPLAIAPVPKPAEVLPPIPNAIIAGACKIAFPPLVVSQVEAIQRAVLRKFPGLTMVDLKSERRTGRLVKARQIAMYLSKEITPRSFPDIGRRFGGRDHTTVIHSCRRVAAFINPENEKYDASIAGLVESLRAEIGGIACAR